MDKLTTFSDTITFGKYKGFSVEDVCNKEDDASYLVWLIEATKRTQFSDLIESKIYKAAEHQGRYKMEPPYFD